MEIRKIDIIIDAVMMGLIIYYVADELSDGAFSRELGIHITKGVSRFREYYRRENRIAKDTGKVIFDAITIVEDGGDNKEG